MGCHPHVQGIFLTQGSNLHLLYWRAGSSSLVAPQKLVLGTNPAKGNGGPESEGTGVSSDVKQEGHPRLQEELVQRPGGLRCLPCLGPAQVALGAEWAGARPVTALRGLHGSWGGPSRASSLRALLLEEGPGNRSRRAVGSSCVDGAICVARPGADGRAPCGPRGHSTCTVHVCLHVDTWRVCRT